MTIFTPPLRPKPTTPGPADWVVLDLEDATQVTVTGGQAQFESAAQAASGDFWEVTLNNGTTFPADYPSRMPLGFVFDVERAISKTWDGPVADSFGAGGAVLVFKIELDPDSLPEAAVNAGVYIGLIDGDHDAATSANRCLVGGVRRTTTGLFVLSSDRNGTENAIGPVDSASSEFLVTINLDSRRLNRVCATPATSASGATNEATSTDTGIYDPETLKIVIFVGLDSNSDTGTYAVRFRPKAYYLPL